MTLQELQDSSRSQHVSLQFVTPMLLENKRDAGRMECKIRKDKTIIQLFA